MFFRSKVENNMDPTNTQKVQVRVLGIHSSDKQDIPSKILPWAEPTLPITSGKVDGGYGNFDVPDIGDWVWVFFEENDTFKQHPYYFGTIRGDNDKDIDYKQTLNHVNKDRWNNKKIIDKDHTEWKNGKGTVKVDIQESGDINLKMDNKKGEVNLHIDTDGNFTIDVTKIPSKASFTINSTKDITLHSDKTGKVHVGNSPSTDIVNWEGLENYFKVLEKWLDTHIHVLPNGVPVAPHSAPFSSIGTPLHLACHSPKIKISNFSDI